MYTHTLVKNFQKKGFSVQYMKWIPLQVVMSLYNDKVAKVFKTLDGRDNSKEDKEKKFECFMSKFQKGYTKEISDDYVLFVVSKNYGFLFVDFTKEGIIQMEIGLNSVAQAFDLITINSPDVKRSLMVTGSKHGEVNFIQCDIQLRESHMTINKAHTS